MENKRVPLRNAFGVELHGTARTVEFAQDHPVRVRRVRRRKYLAVLRIALVDQRVLLPIRMVFTELVPAGALDDPLRAALHDEEPLLQAEFYFILPRPPRLPRMDDTPRGVGVLGPRL